MAVLDRQHGVVQQGYMNVGVAAADINGGVAGWWCWTRCGPTLEFSHQLRFVVVDLQITDFVRAASMIIGQLTHALGEARWPTTRVVDADNRLSIAHGRTIGQHDPQERTERVRADVVYLPFCDTNEEDLVAEMKAVDCSSSTSTGY